jgi:hypothetical protein
MSYEKKIGGWFFRELVLFAKEDEMGRTCSMPERNPVACKKAGRERPIGRRRREDNIKMCFRKIGWFRPAENWAQ